jgi:hypothetical protein
VNIALWVMAACALSACEVASRRLDHGWPTGAQIFRSLRGHLAGRLVLIVGWLWLGWHVFAR